MRGAECLLLTPWSPADHFERGKLLLTRLGYSGYDEAESHAGLGFIPILSRICMLIPFTRQTLFLFSKPCE